MNFKCTENLKYPIEQSWVAFRDHLPDVASQLDDIEYVKVEKRAKKAPNAVHVISIWKSDPPLPAFLKGFIKPDMLIWTDDAVWDNSDTTCRFNINTHYKIEDISCIGSIEFTSAGKGTKIVYSGVLTIKKTARSSIFMTGFIIKGIEAVAATLIEKNFAKVVRTAGDYIKTQK